jgi:hypothetical protein
MSADLNASKDVNSLQREKEAALLMLGKAMHKLIRDGQVKNAFCVKLTDRIAQIDAEICIAGGGSVPGQGEGVCPNCSTQLAVADAAFCGSCGMNITEYYARNTVQCVRCRNLTASDGKYCTICGVLRA